MGKLLYYIVTSTYLFLPLAFLFFRCKFKDRVPTLLFLYGIIFFAVLVVYYDYVPKSFQKYYQVTYTFLEYSVFTSIFWYQIKTRGFKVFILIASSLFFIFQIFFVTTASFKRLDSVAVGVETILLFIYIFYFFYEFSKQIKNTFIYNHYTFWIAVGIMIYLGGSFFFYILINSLTPDEVDKFGIMAYIAEVIKNLLFAFAIFMYIKHPSNNIHKLPKNIPNLDMNVI